MLPKPKAKYFHFWKPIPNHAPPKLSLPLPYYHSSTTAHNMQLTALFNRGDVAAARRLFDEMPHRTVVSWNAMVSGYANFNNGHEALSIAALMHRSGVGLNEATLSSVLGACARMGFFGMGRQVHCHVVKSGFEDFSLVGGALLDFYSSCFDFRAAHMLFEFLHPRNELLWSPMLVSFVRCNRLREALDFLERMPAPRDVFAWAALISFYARSANECEKALQLFVRMFSGDGVMPNEFTYDSVLRACVKLEALEFGRSIHGCLIRSGFESEHSITGALVDLYCGCDVVNDALLVYSNLEMPSLNTSNALIGGLISIGRMEDAEMVFSQMPEHNSVPYNLMIRAYAIEGRLEDCKRMFEKMPCRNIVSMHTMMSAFLQNGKLGEGLKLFEQIKDEKNTVTWNSMISGHIQNDQSSEALKLFVAMRQLSVECSSSTFPALLHACAAMGTLEQGKMVHASLCKTPFESNVYVGTALVDMYSKCGCVTDARTAFGCIASPNVASWTSLINGFAHNGHCLEAMLQFGRMLKRHVDPNEITFVGLLMASARAGLVNRGMRFFNSMGSYRLVPTVEHYACIVDLLGRSGRLREAEKLISEMPLPADGVVWGALLTACWYSMDLDMGEKVADKLLCMGTKQISAYVAMSNIYAKSGKWEDVVKVRTRLRNLDVKKEPGCSWIELKDLVHVFRVEDRYHPERDEIYLMLEDLVANITLYSGPEYDDDLYGYPEPELLDFSLSSQN